MNIGLIGLQNSGKTTIFNAMTGAAAEVTAYASNKTKPNRAIVDVLDDRVGILSEMYNPKKTIYTTIEVVDFVGLSEGSASHDIFSAEAMSMIKTSNVLGIVLRNFEDPTIESAQGAANPTADLETIESELILSDLIVIEKRLERIEKDLKRNKKTPELEKEQKVLQKMSDGLNENLAIRAIEITDEEAKTVSGFQFLSSKPVFIILNSGEGNYSKNEDLTKKMSETFPVIEFSGNFEMELSQLEPEDAAAFMEDLGISESAKARLTTFAYEILGYISFFTVGPDEVRAWTIRKGDNAVTAAGAIHTDLARGFIRAECFSYAHLIADGDEKGLKANGHFQLESKTYIVKDGDILNIRFSV